MRGVPEVAYVDEPYENTNGRDNLRELVSKLIQLAFQGSFLTDLRGNRLVDVANGRVLTRKNDNSACAPIYDCRTLLQVSITICGRHERKLQRTVKSIFVISCLTALTSGMTPKDLLTLTLSPVRMAWSTRKLLEDTERSLQSAGILSPTETATISPGTILHAFMRFTLPERSTFASSGEYCIKAFMRKRVSG
jgi:hypothetical protein